MLAFMTDHASELPSAADLARAAERLRGHVHRTPLLSSRTLGDRVGARVLLKCENLQRAGSFKIRGALNTCLQLHEAGEIGSAGVITYSSGNHAQAVALAASILGCAATVVVPETIPAVKRAATEGYGARVITCGHTSLERRERAETIASDTGARVIPPFDHPWIIEGQSTVGREIIEDAPETRTILVPIGGGGLIAGVALAAATSGADVRVLGVEPHGADAMRQSLAAGRKVTLPGPPDTIADGLCPVAPGDLTLEAARRHVEEVLLVDDRAIRDAQRWLLERAKLLVEPSGAATTAALLAAPERFRGQEVAVVLSGGNCQIPALTA